MEVNKIEVIEVEKPSINRTNIARSAGMMIGLAVLVIGIIFCGIVRSLNRTCNNDEECTEGNR